MIFGFRSLGEILLGGRTLFYTLSINSMWNVKFLALRINTHYYCHVYE